VVVGGGPSADGERWLPSRADFFVPDKALSRLYRATFRVAMQHAGLFDQIDPAVWTKDWVVRSKAVGDGRTTLQYLAAYVFRVAIRDYRIVSCEQGEVTFSYRKRGSRRGRRMRLHPHEFLRRFLQHVLPSGLQKLRHYGFLSPRSRQHLETLRWLITLQANECFVLQAVQTAAPSIESSPLHCAECGGDLYLVCFIRRGRALFDTS
jgi:hypothetical protein